MPTPLSEAQIAELKNTLKRCSQTTIDSVLKFRGEGDASLIPSIVMGVIERYLPPEAPGKSNLSNPDSRLGEDLGIDSLTMLEIVLLIEEALDIHIEDTELRGIKTVGDINGFLAAKISGMVAPTIGRNYDTDAILAVLPQQHPFLFVDSACVEPEVVRAAYLIRGDEVFLRGHFKDNPVFPASLAFEALGQAACLWVLEHTPAELQNRQVFFASMEGAHFYRRCVPGDVLEMEVKLDRMRDPLAVFSGLITVNGERACKVERLVLAFGENLQERVQADSFPAVPVPTVEAVPAAA